MKARRLYDVHTGEPGKSLGIKELASSLHDVERKARQQCPDAPFTVLLVLQLHNTGRQQTESGDHLSTKLKEKTKQNKTKQNKTNKQTKNIQQEEAGVIVVCRMFVQCSSRVCNEYVHSP